MAKPAPWPWLSHDDLIYYKMDISHHLNTYERVTHSLRPPATHLDGAGSERHLAEDRGSDDLGAGATGVAEAGEVIEADLVPAAARDTEERESTWNTVSAPSKLRNWTLHCCRLQAGGHRMDLQSSLHYTFRTMMGDFPSKSPNQYLARSINSSIN